MVLDAMVLVSVMTANIQLEGRDSEVCGAKNQQGSGKKKKPVHKLLVRM